MKSMEAKPILNELPNPDGEAAIYKEVIIGFPCLLAQGENATI
jgi:hypothetical protein